MFDGYEQKQAAFQQPVFVLREVMRFHHRLRYHSIGEQSNRSFSKAVSLQLYEKFKGRTKV
jgi:hypothetical protein